MAFPHKPTHRGRLRKHTWSSVRNRVPTIIFFGWIGIGITLFLLQGRIILYPEPDGTVRMSGIAYGYHKEDSTDHCGDGTVESAQNETCDPSAAGAPSDCRARNTSGSTACTNECCTYCGDGNIDNNGGGEVCDDSNTTNGDGCDSACAVETGFSCAGDPSTCSAICGDGLIKGTEGCDDSNTTGGDGCDASCAIEFGFSCSGEASTCSATCGDGNKSSNEDCDDGGTSNGDGCSEVCTVETQYTCTGTQPSSCTKTGGRVGVGSSGGGGSTAPRKTIKAPRYTPDNPPPPCGNSIVEPELGEECDKGRSNGISECTEECILLYCGDGTVSHQKPLNEECEVQIGKRTLEDPETGEEIEELFYVSADCGRSCSLPVCTGCNCSGGCTIEFLPPCSGSGGLRTMPIPEKDCGAKKASSSSSSSMRPPPPAHCGNGILEEDKGEQCDRAYLNGLGDCSLWCEVLHCGDGEISANLGEECEPTRDEEGDFIASTCGEGCSAPICRGDKCSGGCQTLFLPSCEAGLVVVDTIEDNSSELDEIKSNDIPEIIEEPVTEVSEESIEPLLIDPELCGNKKIEGEEECDDGNTVDFDGCSALCILEEAAEGRCGDGIADPWEECDDGDGNADDISGACRTTCRFAYCGDSVIDPQEECDDGNMKPGDGCSPSCRKSYCGNGALDTGESCDAGQRNSDTEPDRCRRNCTIPSCGDRVIDPSFGEECDMGGLNSDTEPNMCRVGCILPYCGDSIRDEGEDCDDGNDDPEDMCSNDCMTPVCGNGIRQGFEKCDDGNTDNKDGCSSTCQNEDIDGILLTLTILGIGGALGALFVLRKFIPGLRWL